MDTHGKEEDWRRVAAALETALDTLGWPVTTLIRRSSASNSTVYDLLKGERHNYRPETLEPIERTLGWKAGTMREVARGVQPPPADPFREDRQAAIEARVAALEDRVTQLAEALEQGDDLQ